MEVVDCVYTVVKVNIAVNIYIVGNYTLVGFHVVHSWSK